MQNRVGCGQGYAIQNLDPNKDQLRITYQTADARTIYHLPRKGDVPPMALVGSTAYWGPHSPDQVTVESSRAGF